LRHHSAGRNGSQGQVLRKEEALRLSVQFTGRTAFLLTLILFFPVHTSTAVAARGSVLSLGFDGTLGEEGIPRPWNIGLKEGRAGVGIVVENGQRLLHLECRESSFSVERNISIDVSNAPYISWTWKVLKAPSHGDVRKKNYNDQALQILVAFENRKVLSYVWDSNAPEGTVTDESLGWPFNLQIKVVVVKSGTADAGKWITHTRNLYEDYMHIFHEEPVPIKGVRIQTNTQHTKDVAEGYIKGISFGAAFP